MNSTISPFPLTMRRASEKNQVGGSTADALIRQAHDVMRHGPTAMNRYCNEAQTAIGRESDAGRRGALYRSLGQVSLVNSQPEAGKEALLKAIELGQGDLATVRALSDELGARVAAMELSADECLQLIAQNVQKQDRPLAVSAILRSCVSAKPGEIHPGLVQAIKLAAHCHDPASEREIVYGKARDGDQRDIAAKKTSDPEFKRFLADADRFDRRECMFSLDYWHWATGGTYLGGAIGIAHILAQAVAEVEVTMAFCPLIFAGPFLGIAACVAWHWLSPWGGTRSFLSWLF